MYTLYCWGNTTKHSLAIKTMIQLKKSRYVIFVLQSDKKNIMTAGKTYFDTCKLINVKLYLNFEFYPYDDLNLDFGKAAILYVFTFLYVLLSNLWKKWTIILIKLLLKSFTLAIDCSRQNEFVKSNTVDVRLTFQFKRMYQRIQPLIALPYMTAWSNIAQCQIYTISTRLRKLSSFPPLFFNIWDKIQDPLWSSTVSARIYR